MRSALDKSATPTEKMEFIFSHIFNYEYNGGQKINREGGASIDFSTCYMNYDPNYFGLNSHTEMKFYLDTLEEQGLVILDERSRSSWNTNNDIIIYYQRGKITFKGLNYLREIETKGLLSNKCFVAMAFDEKKKQRLTAIKQACLEHNFDAFIIEEYKTKENQTIDANIIAAIKSARFCIADFTSINRGAYFEAGYAMGRNMKVIFICEEADFTENKKHFDVNHYPFLAYKDFSDLTNKLKIEIAAYIKD